MEDYSFVILLCIKTMIRLTYLNRITNISGEFGSKCSQVPLTILVVYMIMNKVIGAQAKSNLPY